MGHEQEAAGLVDWSRYLKAVKRAHVVAQWQCDTELFLGVDVDEISLLFQSEAQLDSFVQWAVESKGLTNFNSVKDGCRSVQVTNGGNQHNYRVRFEFLSMPGVDWRIEAMCILSGDAPLHRIHLSRYGVSPIHASFKLKTLEGYTDMCKHLATYGPGLVPIVEYENSYGRYCYFGGDDMDRIYLKPRVNLRDPETPSS